MVSTAVAPPVEQPRRLTAWKIGRVAQILLVATGLLTSSIINMNVANSLFLNAVGSEHLPLLFVCLGATAAIAFSAISQLVDRLGRLRLLQYVLVGSVATALLMRLLLNLDAPWVYYLLSITAFFQFDLYLNVLFPNLLNTYFTTLEYKRYAPWIGIAQASGILLGGGLTALLLNYFRTPDLLVCLTAFYGLVILQLVYLENTQGRLESGKVKDPGSFLETVKLLPSLIERFPIVFYLASSSFLFIIVYVVSEFIWFSTYAENFTSDELTEFLGLIRIATSTVQIVTLYCFTRPLLQWLGVGRMNLVFPVATLAAFFGFAFNGSLPFAIAVNINGDAFDKSINKPVHQLNYNALPSEFSGKVRALSDGVFYAIGLMLAGCLLWVAHAALTVEQIAWIGIALAAVMLTLRLPIGKLYAGGLEAMIRTNTLALDSDYTLPDESSPAIRELLAERDRYAQINGLELAARVRNPGQFFPDVRPLLSDPDPDLRQSALALFADRIDSDTERDFEELLGSDNLSERAFALEVLAANDYAFSATQLLDLLGASSEIDALVAIAATQAGLEDPRLAAALERLWQGDLDEATARAIARSIPAGNVRELVPLLSQIATAGNAAVKQAALRALAAIAARGDLDAGKVAADALGDEEPLVRVAACDVLGRVLCKELLPQVAAAAGDSDARVRERVAFVLAASGRSGLEVAEECLQAEDEDTVKTAIAAIAQVRTKAASAILLDYLAPDFQQVALTHRWQQQIPAQDIAWRPLAIALADYHDRTIQRVLYVLSCLGYSETVDIVNRILVSTNQREIANAVEVLATLPHRRFVLPLMPLLEQLGQPSKPKRRSNPRWLRSRGYKLLLEALDARDRWIQIGALIALSAVPLDLMRDPDPLVKAVAALVFPRPVRDRFAENTFMNRLLLLKGVALFKNLSLDELLAVDRVLESEQVLAGQTIFKEGDWGTHLYVIAEGGVRMVKTLDGIEEDTRHLSAGQYFGEASLFDEVPRWEGAIAIQDCTLLKLEKSRFLSLVAQRPQIVLEICQFLSQRLRESERFRATPQLMPSITETAATGS